MHFPAATAALAAERALHRSSRWGTAALGNDWGTGWGRQNSDLP